MFDLKYRINYQKCFCFNRYVFTGRDCYRHSSDRSESIPSPLVELKEAEIALRSSGQHFQRTSSIGLLHISNISTFTRCHVKVVLEMMLTAERRVAGTLLCSKV